MATTSIVVSTRASIGRVTPLRLSISSSASSAATTTSIESTATTASTAASAGKPHFTPFLLYKLLRLTNHYRYMNYHCMKSLKILIASSYLSILKLILTSPWFTISMTSCFAASTFSGVPVILNGFSLAASGES